MTEKSVSEIEGSAKFWKAVAELSLDPASKANFEVFMSWIAAQGQAAIGMTLNSSKDHGTQAHYSGQSLAFLRVMETVGKADATIRNMMNSEGHEEAPRIV